MYKFQVNLLCIDELVREPGAKGCISVNGNWFIYSDQDERGRDENPREREQAQGGQLQVREGADFRETPRRTH